MLPPAPERTFASDNAAGAHPNIVEAVVRANRGHALAYGDDQWTRRTETSFCQLFDREVTTLLTFNGTGANVLALASVVGPGDAVVCAASSHINTDEAGAPERLLGAKLIDLPADDGRLGPDQLDSIVSNSRGVHHAHPTVVSITQATELGTLYSIAEIAALCERAHELGLVVHLDGARLANATAALGGDVAALRAMTTEAGVDIVSFGGTKIGTLGGEAVVFLRSDLARRADHLRKNITQLPSKMRFVAAQFEALLTDGLWLELAGSANAMATRLFEAVSPLPGVTLDRPPAVNSLFPVLPRTVIDTLQAWSFFWDWDVPTGQVRWMTAWDTTLDDVDRFAAGVAVAVAEAPASPTSGALHINN